MSLLQNIKEQILLLDKATFNRYLMGFCAIVLTAMISIIYMFYSQKNTTLTKFKTLNQNRLETQEILTRYAIVQKQREDVENLLSKDETFFIGEYFDDLMTNQNIPNAAYQKQEAVTEQATQDYNQIQLTASISGLDMKQLAELLETIEKEERIYIQELDIIKDNKIKKINVNIVIATLEPKSLPAE